RQLPAGAPGEKAVTGGGDGAPAQRLQQPRQFVLTAGKPHRPRHAPSPPACAQPVKSLALSWAGLTGPVDQTGMLSSRRCAGASMRNAVSWLTGMALAPVIRAVPPYPAAHVPATAAPAQDTVTRVQR